MSKKLITIGETYILDISSLAPIQVKTIEFKNEGVLCENLNTNKNNLICYEIFEINGYRKRETIDFEDFPLYGRNIFEYEKDFFKFEEEKTESDDEEHVIYINYYIKRCSDEKFFCQQIEYCLIHDNVYNIGHAYEVKQVKNEQKKIFTHYE